MAKIERKIVTGTGSNPAVDVTGWGFARAETNGSSISISYVVAGRSYEQEYADDDRILIPPGTTSIKVGASNGEAWKLHMQKTVPAVNQRELKLAITESRKLLIEGDDDIVFRGQDTEASADITGIKDDLENLSKLYEKALSTGTVSDAAKYCKLRTAVLARYAN
jgi:Fe-S cluster biosynthesis and repair protein YggX